MKTDYILKQKGTGRQFRIQLVTDTNPPIPVDNTGKTAAFLDWRLRRLPPPAAASLALTFDTNRTTGIVYRDFLDADLAVPGEYVCSVRILTADGKPEYYPQEGYWSILVEPAIV